MNSIKNLAGSRFGKLTVVEFSHRKKVAGGTVIFWRCVCDCGKESVVRSVELSSGGTKSCGCLRLNSGDRTRTHGMSKTKVYELWSAMVQRARGNRAATYVKHGIGVCQDWLEFERFYADMGNPPGPAYSVERIDNDKGYSPSNCKWLPMREQWRNRRNTNLLEFEGKMLSIREIGEITGVNHATLRHRLVVQGMTLERAVQPVARGRS